MLYSTTHQTAEKLGELMIKSSGETVININKSLLERGKTDRPFPSKLEWKQENLDEQAF